MSLREGAIRLVSRIRSLSRGKRLSKHLTPSPSPMKSEAPFLFVM